MKPPAHRGKCPHCQKLFVPDSRHRGRQKCCSAPDCQAASKRGRQARWLANAENQDDCRGPENVKRVQAWRAEHPGCWQCSPRQSRPPTAPQPGTFQVTCSAPAALLQELEPKPPPQGSRLA